MNPDVVIKVENLNKKFCRNLKRSMLYGFFDIMKNMLGIRYDSGKLRRDEFWALQDVNFELKEGEVLGIIGVNGSGKSTLLRLLNGIYPPDKGKIAVRGKIGALIAVGAGFHPHMTGRENIYLNGTILGMTKKEIEEKFQEIIDFADIGEFLDAPVSTYSSGMSVRLGFSIAIHCDPDILLIDEILSVGDLSFRNKSLRRMSEFREKANGVVFISHNLEQVRMLCDRVIILNKGVIAYEGPTHEGCVKYEEMNRKIRLESLKTEGLVDDKKFKNRISSGEEMEIVDFGILNVDNQKVDKIDLNEPLNIFCEFETKKYIDELVFSVSILNDKHDSCIWVMNNDNNKANFRDIQKGKHRLMVSISQHHLAPGIYIPNVAIRNSKTGETYERVLSKNSFRVVSDGNVLERGIVAVNESWNLKKLIRTKQYE